MKIWLNQIACRENLNKDPIIMWVTQHSQYEVGYSSAVACKAQIQPILANDPGQGSWPTIFQVLILDLSTKKYFVIFNYHDSMMIAALHLPMWYVWLCKQARPAC